MLEIIAENTDWLGVNKPTGIPVFPPHKDPHGDCVLHRLLTLLPQQGEHQWPRGFQGGIVHRLDIPTSGALVIAKTPNGLAHWRRRFQQKELHKRYLFLTHKNVQNDLKSLFQCHVK